MMKDHLEVAKAATDVVHVSLRALEAAKALIETQHHHVLAGNNKFIIFNHITTFMYCLSGSQERGEKARKHADTLQEQARSRCTHCVCVSSEVNQ